ncbi:MAG: ribonuclease P protein component [Pirellulaceae bacterium]|jgi:ribonuclease P protein component|nr:ribonuclease P protein component [Pirellulaceae bacterium]
MVNEGAGSLDRSFPKNLRVRSQHDYSVIFLARCSAGDEWLIINGKPRGEDSEITRLGLSIGRRFGNSPQRNQWKRIVREAFRLERANLPSGWDLIVRPRDNKLPTLAEARHSLNRLTRRLAKLRQRNKPV